MKRHPLYYAPVVNAGVAQLVERNLAKVEVESSRLFSRSSFKREAKSGFLFYYRVIEVQYVHLDGFRICNRLRRSCRNTIPWCHMRE